MSEIQTFLKSVHIENYLSLRDVELPLKPLTVLVGPNASGKSNILSALRLLNKMITFEELPSVEFIQDFLWAGEGSHIAFQLHAKAGETPTVYQLKLKAETDNPAADEELLVKDVKVISIQSGQGVVQDEDGKNETRYKSNKLALKSAGDYGDKPITSALTEFLRGWEFYDFRPELMRGHLSRFSFFMGEVIPDKSKALSESPKLDDDGSTLSVLLSYWHENDRERFDSVSKSLADCTHLRIDQCAIDGDNQLCLLEGYEKPIPLKRASDGTLRLVAYYILLNEPELPPLIAIEEPERNLHPGALTDITNVLEQIAERTQVIITTHSSQLLDAFNPENLSDSLGILLLHNRPGQGTEVINLEDIRGNRAALDGWMTDFGIGSAIFNSKLLQDLNGGVAYMPTVRIWTLESDHDAKAVKCLANKLVAHLQLGNLSIQASGRNEVPKGRGAELMKATRNYLKQDACVIFVIDSDSPMSTHERRQQQNSLINQIERIVNNSSFAGKVFLAQAIQEFEAWLLIDCLGVFCCFASKRTQYRENCRNKVSTNQSFSRLIERHQKGNTENIVEAEMGGKGAKEYLEEFSEKILLALNPNMPPRNVNRQRYREAMSPKVAEHVDINQATLRRNNSLRKLGSVLTRFNQS